MLVFPSPLGFELLPGDDRNVRFCDFGGRGIQRLRSNGPQIEERDLDAGEQCFGPVPTCFLSPSKVDNKSILKFFLDRTDALFSRLHIDLNSDREIPPPKGTVLSSFRRSQLPRQQDQYLF